MTGQKLVLTGVYKQTFDNGDETYARIISKYKNGNYRAVSASIYNGELIAGKTISIQNPDLWTFADAIPQDVMNNIGCISSLKTDKEVLTPLNVTSLVHTRNCECCGGEFETEDDDQYLCSSCYESGIIEGDKEDNVDTAMKKHGAFFAFNNKQFTQQMTEGIAYTSLGGGLTCPSASCEDLAKDIAKITADKIRDDLKANGKKAIIHRELDNHEAGYTYSINETVDALVGYGITAEEVQAEFNEYVEHFLASEGD